MQIHEIFLVIILALAVGYAYSKYSEVEILKTKNEQLTETKGHCEAHKMFVVEKEDAVKKSSETHLANTDRLMNMLMNAQDSLANSRGDSVKNEEKCSKQLEKLRREFSSVQKNMTELVKLRERASMQANMYSDKLEWYKVALNEEKGKLAECKRQYNRCWWC